MSAAKKDTRAKLHEDTHRMLCALASFHDVTIESMASLLLEKTIHAEHHGLTLQAKALRRAGFLGSDRE